MKVIWSDFAESQLDEIYDYNKKNASPSIANKLVKEIINEAQKLRKAPLIGQVEEFLKHRKIKYRYFIFKNYKIIYSEDLQEGLIRIYDVFDTRQNPPKLKRNG